MSAIGFVISSMLKDGGGRNKCYVETLNNAGRLLSNLHHSESISRRELLCLNLNKDLKDTLHNTTLSSLLFGGDLDNTIKTAKDLEKSGEQLKLQKKPVQLTTTRSLKQGNFKRPPIQKRGVQQSGRVFRTPSNQRQSYYTTHHRHAQKNSDRQQPRERKRHQY